MRVQTTARHCDVPDDVIDRTQELAEALVKYEPRASAAEVVFEEEKLTRRVEIRMRIDGAEPVIAHGEGSEFRTALDRAVDHARRRLRKSRQRRTDHQAPPLAESLGGE